MEKDNNILKQTILKYRAK